MKGFAIVELLILLAIAGIIVGMAAYTVEERKKQPATYHAWAKQTGNPKNLTFDEWKLLMKASERSHDVWFVPVPMYTGR